MTKLTKAQLVARIIQRKQECFPMADVLAGTALDRDPNHLAPCAPDCECFELAEEIVDALQGGRDG